MSDLPDELPDWLNRFLEKRLSAEASTKPYEQYFFELMTDRELSLADKLVGITIWMHAKRDGQDAWPCQDLIAWIVGRNVETVRRSNRKLEKRCFLSTVTGKRQRSSRYTLLVRNHALADIPKRTLDELVAIFHPLAGEVPPPRQCGGDPLAGEGGTYLSNLPTEPPNYTAMTGSDYTDEVGASHLGRTAGKSKRKRKARHGRAMFEFLPEERALEEVFAEGETHDTEDVTDAEIVDTIRKATAGKIGKALLTEDGVFTVRMMMASMMFHTGCDAQSAIAHIQGLIWHRIGNRGPEERLTATHSCSSAYALTSTCRVTASAS